FSERLAEAGIQPSVGAVGSSYDNALAETINGLYKTELIKPGKLNRPGMSGDSSSWKGWGHVRWFIEEVPAGAA
ncbi:IS3 family transposase, partial [Mycobacterium tuberculosis]